MKEFSTIQQMTTVLLVSHLVLLTNLVLIDIFKNSPNAVLFFLFRQTKFQNCKRRLKIV